MGIEEQLSQAAAAEVQGLWAEAAKLYGAVLEATPGNQIAKEKLAWCMSRAKEYSQAIALLQDLAEAQPKSAKWPYMVGYQYHEQENWRQAVEWYDRSLRLNPNYVVVLYRKGYAHAKLAHVGDALRCFERCREIWHALPEGPNKDRDKKNCAKAAYHQAEVVIENPRLIDGGVETAIPLLDEAIRLDPRDHHSYYLKGKAYLGAGQPEQALEALRQADHLEPNQDYVLDRWGKALAHLNRLEEAEQVFQRIPVDKRKDYVLRNLGEIQFKRGNYHQAIQTLSKAINKNNRNHNGHYLLGLCYQGTSEWGLAVRAFREAIRLRERHYKVPFPEAQRALEQVLAEHSEAANAAPIVRLRGKVADYFTEKGYGFIQGPMGKVFFHIKDCQRNVVPEKGQFAEYEETMGERGPKAVKVRIAGRQEFK
jgi:tetratricopeptide (TPR) repeat protein